MIQIEAVQIRELRGVRDLEVVPDRKNFVVTGPNGSGKSGVVDAIQFALTGEISRLSGKGTGGLSVSRHGPHVDRRDDPAAAEVELRVFVPELGKTAVITRAVKTAKTFNLEPDDPKIREVIEEVALHPELTLSRREIIRYILVEAGQRSKEIQALLKLEEVGETRGILKTMSNKLSIEFKNAQGAAKNAGDALRRHLDIQNLSSEDILASVNPHRRTLGLPDFSALSTETNVAEGVLSGSNTQTFDRGSALRDVEALSKAVVALPDLEGEALEGLVRDLETLESDRELRDAITHRSFVEKGLELVDGPACPLCNLGWPDEETLKAHLREKMEKADQGEALQERLLKNASAIAGQARRVAGLIEAIENVASSEGPDGLQQELSSWAKYLKGFASQLGPVEEIQKERSRIVEGWHEQPPSLIESLGFLKSAIQGKPDQSATVAAQTFLSLAQDRLVAYRSARRDEARASKAVESGKAVYRSYCDCADKYLASLYEAVEDSFASYYREINAEDEGAFKAKLEPAEGGLDLEVAFYDKGMFPPGAYHSEGHQDGMGVCLYLALMRRLLGDRFRFVVLDDVVMSVDHGHRKKFCRLLKAKFPETQFIITTHDRVWAKQMQSEGLVGSKGGVAFHSWSVQTGPVVEQPADVWEQLDTDLSTGAIDVAAGRLRRHMEYVSGELADRLGARPPYRGDHSYDLGDLLPAVIGRHGDLLKRAAKAANSWTDEATQARVEDLKKARAEALAAYGGESWVVNKAVHWNEWAGFTPDEFREVSEAFKVLLAQLRCSKAECESWLYVTPRKGDEEALRCSCTATNINLKPK